MHRPMRPISADYPTATVEDAYAIQRARVVIRPAEGHRVVGHRIGLTSKGCTAGGRSSHTRPICVARPLNRSTIPSHTERMSDKGCLNLGNLLTPSGWRIIDLSRWLSSTDGLGNLRKLATAGILLALILDLVGAGTFVHWLTPHANVTILRGSHPATDVGFSQIFKTLGKFGT